MRFYVSNICSFKKWSLLYVNHISVQPSTFFNYMLWSICTMNLNSHWFICLFPYCSNVTIFCIINFVPYHIKQVFLTCKKNYCCYADDTTLMAESEEELKSLLMKVKEESEEVGLKLNIQKMKIMASGPITSWEIDGETVESVRCSMSSSNCCFFAYI